MGEKELENINSERDNSAVNHVLKDIAKDCGFPIHLRVTDSEPQKWVNFALNRVTALLNERGNMGNFENHSTVEEVEYAKARYERITAEVTELSEAVKNAYSQYSTQDSIERSLQTLKELYEDRESYRMKRDQGRKLRESARKLKAVENSRLLQVSAVNFNKTHDASKLEANNAGTLSVVQGHQALAEIENEIADIKSRYVMASVESARYFNDSRTLLEQGVADEKKELREKLERKGKTQYSQVKFKHEAIKIDEKHSNAMVELGGLRNASTNERKAGYISIMKKLKEKREEILLQMAESGDPAKRSNEPKSSSENAKEANNTIVDDMIKSRTEVALQSKDWLDTNGRLEQVRAEGVNGLERIKKLNSIIDEIAGRELTPENLTSRARECGDIEQYLGDFVKEFEPVRASYSVMKEDQKVMRRLHKKWDNRTSKAEKAIATAKENGLPHKAKEFQNLWEMAEDTRIQMEQNVSSLDEQVTSVTNLIHESNMAKTKLLSIIVSCNRFVRNYGTVGSPDSSAMKMLSTAFQNITNYEDSLNAGKALEKPKQMMEIF